MAMRFFDQQIAARRRSRRLTLAFALAVAATVVGMHVVLMLPWLLLRWFLQAPLGYPLGFMPVNLLAATGLILGGWWLERSHLARGGVALAERLGARPARPETRFEEERLVHVVSEICTAAHMPRPRVMVLPRHPGINAFAAGFEPADWALAVSDGALEQLTRAELQGLVAHECSHLKEGDTRLNMQLISMVSGLQMIWGFGRSLLPDSDTGRTSQGERGMSLHDLTWIAGIPIMAAGYVGWLAGRILQAAVSREREYLADARAVQWTRSADSLGGTLRKLMTQQHEAGSERLQPGHLKLAAHLFLVADDGRWPLPDGRNASRQPWLASHPLLADRVRRIYGRPRGPLPLQRMDPRTGLPAGADRAAAAPRR
ncbi:MAG: M48 family metalloprotease [Ottowia sp.]|nr:M48 family metalloprotease [Ottowia sp.]